MKTVQTIENYDSVGDSFLWYNEKWLSCPVFLIFYIDIKNVRESANLSSIIRENSTISWFMVMNEKEAK